MSKKTRRLKCKLRRLRTLHNQTLNELNHNWEQLESTKEQLEQMHNINGDLSTEFSKLKQENADTLEWFVLMYGSLKELVELREMKVRLSIGESREMPQEYIERKPMAWRLAKDAIELWAKSDHGINLSVIGKSCKHEWIAVTENGMTTTGPSTTKCKHCGITGGDSPSNW